MSGPILFFKLKGDLAFLSTCLTVCHTVSLCLSPEDVADAALTEAVSTLGLAGLTQDQPAGLAAVFGFWSSYKVISESSVKRQETCRDTWAQRHT